MRHASELYRVGVQRDLDNPEVGEELFSLVDGVAFADAEERVLQVLGGVVLPKVRASPKVSLE